MSGPGGQAIINRTGSIPGASQGINPPGSPANGDWFADWASNGLFRWDGNSWVLLLNGSGGAQDLQGVTDLGYVTTNPLYAEGWGQSVVGKTGNYNAKISDFAIYVNALGGQVSIVLPVIRGGMWCVKKIDGTANAVTISGATGLIDGQPSQALTLQYASDLIQCDGSNFFIIAKK